MKKREDKCERVGSIATKRSKQEKILWALDTTHRSVEYGELFWQTSPCSSPDSPQGTWCVTGMPRQTEIGIFNPA